MLRILYFVTKEVITYTSQLKLFAFREEMYQHIHKFEGICFYFNPRVYEFLFSKELLCVSKVNDSIFFKLKVYGQSHN